MAAKKKVTKKPAVKPDTDEYVIHCEESDRTTTAIGFKNAVIEAKDMATSCNDDYGANDHEIVIAKVTHIATRMDGVDIKAV